MFDVAWKDPSIETNAERRQRKEKEEAKGSRRSSVKSASSSGESSKVKGRSSSLQKGWGLFGGSTNTLTSKKKPLTISEKDDASTRNGKKSVSSAAFMSGGRDNDNDIYEESGRVSPGTTNGELASSRERQSSYTADTSWDGSVYISKTPDPESSPENLFTKLSIGELRPSLYETIPEDFHDEYSSFPNPSLQPRLLRPSQMTPRSSSRNRLQDRNLESSARGSPFPPSARLDEPPMPPPSTPLPTPQQRSQSQAQNRQQQLETTFQRTIRRMDAASAKIILERLREEWEEVVDTSIYEELEFDKELWMLAGLKFLLVRQKAKDDIAAFTRGAPFSPVPTSLPVGKVLSLYETQASATYLSTTHQTSEIHHLSNTPCTTTQIPHFRLRDINIATPVSALPYPSSTFSIISCLPLVSVLPSPSLPSLLKECYRALEPGGKIQLTLMDPTPLNSTMGPITQNWFEEHLVLKLEIKFRCLKPTRLVPVWLQDAGFSLSSASKHSSVDTMRSAGTTGLKAASESNNLLVTFPAVARGEGEFQSSSAKRDAAVQSKREIELLTSMVGRMLWKELWGKYVVGRQWWWEDERVVEECKSLGTRWDVMFLEGVKTA